MCHSRLQVQISIFSCCMTCFCFWWCWCCFCIICFGLKCCSKVALSHVCQDICSAKVVFIYLIRRIDLIAFTNVIVIFVLHINSISISSSTNFSSSLGEHACLLRLYSFLHGRFIFHLIRVARVPSFEYVHRITVVLRFVQMLIDVVV